MTDFHIANPWALYLLWLALGYAALAYSRLRKQRVRLDSFMSATMRARLAPPLVERKVKIQIALCTTGILLTLIALARPQWGQKDETVLSRGRDVVIALDVSRSMLAADVHPNRLSRAKADILDLFQALKGDRAAIIAFRHQPSLLSPLTTDYAYLRLILEGVDIDSAPRGETDIGSAILAALDAFEERSGSHRTIVLISDGEDLSGQAMSAAAEAAKAGVPIYTIGFGREQGAPIPAEAGGVMTHEGTDVTTRLDHTTLESIARTTGGAYIPIGTASMTKSNLGTVYQEYITSIGTREFSESLKRRYIDRYQYFLLPALLIFLAAAAMSQGRPRLSSVTASREQQPLQSKAMLLLIGLLFSGVLQSATADESYLEQAREAQKAYKQGNFEEAAELYRDALQATGRNLQDELRFNQAVSLYQAGKFDEATALFTDLMLSSPNPKELPAMELGMSLFQEAAVATPTNAASAKLQSEAFRRATEAFRDAIRSRPDQRDQAEQNMSAAITHYDQATQNARTAAIQEKYGEKSPSELASAILALERDIVSEAQTAITNTSPSRIKQLENVSTRQTDAANALAMLRTYLQTENAADTAKLQNHVTSIENSMRAASRALRDLDDTGYHQAANAEQALYPLWKGVADPQSLLKEDLLRQTRVVTALSNPPPYAASIPDDQLEAAQVTALFKERFDAMPLDQEKPEPVAPGPRIQTQQPQSSAMAPETKARILSLCDETTNSQIQAHQLLTAGDTLQASFQAAAAYDKLKEIESLMPKDDQQQQQNQQNQDQQKNESDKSDDSQQKKDQDSKDEEKPDPADKDEKQDESKDEKKDEDNKQDEKSPDEPSAMTNAIPVTPEEVKQALEKALQREREHEAVLRERRRQTEMAPIGRDW